MVGTAEDSPSGDGDLDGILNLSAMYVGDHVNAGRVGYLVSYSNGLDALFANWSIDQSAGREAFVAHHPAEVLGIEQFEPFIVGDRDTGFG